MWKWVTELPRMWPALWKVSFHVRRDVGYVAVLQRDRVFDRLADLRRFVRRRAPLLGGDVEVVEGEQTHEIAGRLSRVDRAVVAVFKQEGTNAEWSRWA